MPWLARAERIQSPRFEQDSGAGAGRCDATDAGLAMRGSLLRLHRGRGAVRWDRGIAAAPPQSVSAPSPNHIAGRFPVQAPGPPNDGAGPAPNGSRPRAVAPSDVLTLAQSATPGASSSSPTASGAA